MMATFTFFVEKAGSTIIEQFDARSSADAVRVWYEKTSTDPGPVPEPPDDEASPITDRPNVWCFTVLDNSDTVYSVHFTGPIRLGAEEID